MTGIRGGMLLVRVVSGKNKMAGPLYFHFDQLLDERCPGKGWILGKEAFYIAGADLEGADS